MSWVMQRNVAGAQRVRAAFRRFPGANVPARRRLVEDHQAGCAPTHGATQPHRWPSPPESKAPPAPSGVCKPMAAASTSSSCAASTASPTARRSPSLPKRRFSSSDRSTIAQRDRPTGSGVAARPASARAAPGHRPAPCRRPADTSRATGRSGWTCLRPRIQRSPHARPRLGSVCPPPGSRCPLLSRARRADRPQPRPPSIAEPTSRQP